jgi:hypothetical protein
MYNIMKYLQQWYLLLTLLFAIDKIITNYCKKYGDTVCGKIVKYNTMIVSRSNNFGLYIYFFEGSMFKKLLQILAMHFHKIFILHKTRSVTKL